MADIILAFEKLEALRWIDYLKPDGKMIINDQQIDPIPVIIGKAKYPEGILNKIKTNFDNIITVDGLSIAKKCGTIKAVNTVLIGIMAASLDLPKSEWLDSVKAMVPDRFIDVNIRAFEEGYNYSMG